MTREEAKSCISTIEMLQRLAYNIHGVMDVIDADNCEKIIKALEQEPCGDAISRRAYIERFRKWGYSEFGRKMDNEELAIRVAMSLPPVNPQEPKIGHWMGDSYGYICSNCEHSLNDLAQSMDYISFSKPKFCPNCGAKMVEQRKVR